MPPNQPPDRLKNPTLDDYLEVMSKTVFQSGMSWQVVDHKWPTIREAFDNFDVHKVANFSPFELEELANDTRVIRNRRKLAAIIGNAQKLIELDRQNGSFRKYLRSLGDFDSTLKALRKEFKFLGPSAVYYFLWVVGEEVPPHEEFEATYRK